MPCGLSSFTRGEPRKGFRGTGVNEISTWGRGRDGRIPGSSLSLPASGNLDGRRCLGAFWMSVAKSVAGGWDRLFQAYQPGQLFSLISNIESYPGFIPGCVATRVLERIGDETLRVDNVFGFGPVRSRFTTKAVLRPPEGLHISSNDGPWHDFSLAWTLAPEGPGCRVGCRYAARFRSLILAKMAQIGLPEMERATIAAFEQRARALYG